MTKGRNDIDMFDDDFKILPDKTEEMSIREYLEGCETDPGMYATAATRMVKAIGEPTLVDTSKDPRLGRIFFNQTLRIYDKAFPDFFAMEESIQAIVKFFIKASQGLEERKQILYLLGPVGGGKSSLAERLKFLMQREPIYVLKVSDRFSLGEGVSHVSPVFESPLGLFGAEHLYKYVEKYGIPPNQVKGMIVSPWAVKRLKEFDGEWENFRVVKMYPSVLQRIGIQKTEPGDENNQDVSTLVGKVNIRSLEYFNEDDPDVYGYSGGLNRTTQGLMEFVEMFKAPIKMLHPLLTATQEGHYTGTENIGTMPYNGIIIAHSNESEWEAFSRNENNEAFLDRICIVKIPYCLRVTEEKMIYEKLIKDSELDGAPCAPRTLEILAQFSVLTRLRVHKNSSLYSKMRVYNGEADVGHEDPRTKTLQEYKDEAGVNEGMSGSSTRFGYKILAETFNFDPIEIAADPVHLLHVLEEVIINSDFEDEVESRYLEFVKEDIAPKVAEYVGKEIQRSYLESYDEYGQNLFDKYCIYADAWLEDVDFKDPDTGTLMDKGLLDRELNKIEKPAGIANPKDFRYEVVKFAMRYRAKHEGKNPGWKTYQKIREVIEARMFNSMEEMLPVISFGAKKEKAQEKKHKDFVGRMCEKGYTEKQVRRLVEWYIRYIKS